MANGVRKREPALGLRFEFVRLSARWLVLRGSFPGSLAGIHGRPMG